MTKNNFHFLKWIFPNLWVNYQQFQSYNCFPNFIAKKVNSSHYSTTFHLRIFTLALFRRRYLCCCIGTAPRWPCLINELVPGRSESEKSILHDAPIYTTVLLCLAVYLRMVVGRIFNSSFPWRHCRSLPSVSCFLRQKHFKRVNDLMSILESNCFGNVRRLYFACNFQYWLSKSSSCAAIIHLSTQFLHYVKHCE